MDLFFNGSTILFFQIQNKHGLLLAMGLLLQEKLPNIEKFSALCPNHGRSFQGSILSATAGSMESPWGSLTLWKPPSSTGYPSKSYVWWATTPQSFFSGAGTRGTLTCAATPSYSTNHLYKSSWGGSSPLLSDAFGSPLGCCCGC